ncbi:MAG: radical SAM protein [Myxococcales bacterium]|nr:radical SAM protein [Myxococcales bacterium]
MTRPHRHSLAIELTSRCNQRCGYCYNAWREDNGKGVGALPSDELLALVDRALAEVDFDEVTLTGGEPLARADLFRVLDLCRSHGVTIQMISNGGLVTDAIAERLAGYPINFIQITLNGTTAAVHDEHVGGAHHAATLRGIQALVARGVRVVGSIVVTRKNAGLVGEILDQFRGLGVTTVALSRFSPAGFAANQVGALLPSRSDLIRALADAQARTPALDIQVTMPVPPCVVEHSDYPGIRFGSCPIGTEAQEFALGPRGELRSCTLHGDVIGDTRTTSFAELVAHPTLQAYRDTTPEFCAPCPHRSTCIGGCGAAAATTLGDARGLDPFVAQHVDDAFAARLKRERTRLSVLA